MFDMITRPSSIWDDMFRMADAITLYPFEKTLESNGLKRIINRPHNIVNIKDDDGKTIGQRLEVVTTPFRKENVKVSVKDDFLVVECGAEEKQETKKDTTSEYVYKGISSQSYKFELRLGDNIDKTAIKAKNVDGVLSVTLPFKELKETAGVTTIEIE